MRKRFWASVALASALLSLAAGCGDEATTENAVVRVYVSLPLSGPSARDGRDAADGAELALADAGGVAGGVAVEAVILDGADGKAGWTPARAAANAREATSDSTAIAYLGDFESGATRASLPITSEARMLQVSPASAAEDLVAPFVDSDELPELQAATGRTFGRVIPGDAEQGATGAGWVDELGIRRVSTLSDRTPFGRVLASAFRNALVDAVDARTGAELLYYAGVPERQPASLSQSSRRVLVSDAALEAPQPAGALATSAALDPAHLPATGRRFVEDFATEYGRASDRYGAYGYEAMAVILDSIERAAEPTDRAAVIDAFFETTERESVLGTYSIDEVGETTLDRLSGYRLAHGEPAEPVARLRVP